MKILIVICDRSVTNKILKLFNEHHVNYHISCYARGTANSEILTYFGLAETEKEFVMSFVEDEIVEELMSGLSDVELIKNHGAVAFTIPLDGIGKKTLEFIKHLEEKDE